MPCHTVRGARACEKRRAQGRALLAAALAALMKARQKLLRRRLYEGGVFTAVHLI